MSLVYPVIAIAVMTYVAYSIASGQLKEGTSPKDVYRSGLIASVVLSALAFFFHGSASCQSGDPVNGCDQYADDSQEWTFSGASESAVRAFGATFLAGNIAYYVLKLEKKL